MKETINKENSLLQNKNDKKTSKKLKSESDLNISTQELKMALKELAFSKP